MKPKVKIERLEMEDPTFEAGSSHSAKARLTNPTTKQFTYMAELYLGVAKVATSGAGQVTIPTGGYMDVIFTVVMPATEGDYPVFLDVWSGTTILKHYQGTEDVVITVTPAIEVGPITWV